MMEVVAPGLLAGPAPECCLVTLHRASARDRRRLLCLTLALGGALGGGLGACTGVVVSPSPTAPTAAGAGVGQDGNGGVPADAPIDDGNLPPLPPGSPCRVGAPLRRLTETQYRNAVRDVFGGQAALATDFALATVGTPESGFTTDPSYNAVDLSVSRDLMDSAETVALSLVDKLPVILPCAATPDPTCAGAFLDQFGRRAFRRPLTDSERELLLRAFALSSGADAFKDGIAAMVATMLQSPQFLYQTELGTPADGEVGMLRLTGYEVASRLSFFLWDSVPDDALLDAARDGRLGTAADLRQIADGMLNDPRARPTIARFAREWLHLLVPKPGVDRSDPAYTQDLSDAMQSELDRFVGDSFLVPGTTITQLLTSGAAFGNPTLSAFYDQSGGSGTRSGLLTQPAIMTAIANPSASSPIRRGVMVRRKLTCETFPVPPKDAQSVEGALAASPTASARERSALRNMNSRCSGCHSLIDPLGFGFEAFDEIGRYRTTNGDGSQIDASGDFVDPISPELAGPFADLQELGQRLGSSPTVQQCLTRQLFRFNYGRLDGGADACAISGVLERWAPGMDLRDLMLEMASADEVLFRRVQ